MKDAFLSLHPAVSFLYFAAVIIFGMFFMHPVFLALGLLAALICSLVINGTKALRFGLRFLLPVLVLTSLINPLYNHRGLTVLTYFNNNPITLESVFYGVASGVMFISVLLWFSCFNTVMTSDKLLHLFGKVFPALSLVFCMVLRLVPKLKTQARVIYLAQRGIGRDPGGGSLIKRAKSGMKILSILTTWALENAVDTADSMRSRGYGSKGRKSYSNFRFTSRDLRALLFLCALLVIICAGAVLGENTVSYFPSVEIKAVSVFGVIIYTAYFIFLIFPVLIGLLEDFKWIRMRSRI